MDDSTPTLFHLEKILGQQFSNKQWVPVMEVRGRKGSEVVEEAEYVLNLRRRPPISGSSCLQYRR